MSTNYPYHGGCGTNSYKIISYLRYYGFNVVGLYIDNNTKKRLFDPDKIGNIRFMNMESSASEMNAIKISINNILGGEPRIILAFNYLAPTYARDMYPNTEIIYVSIGSPTLTMGENCMVASGIDSQTFLNGNYEIKGYNEEIEAINNSNKILPNSLLLYKTIKKIYSSEILGNKLLKPIDLSYYTIFNQNDKLNHNPYTRYYDIISVASRWDRKTKGGELCKKILSDNRLIKFKKCIVGDKNDMFNEIENIELVNEIENSETINIMRKSKILIITSLFDASPNVMREALINGCQVLVSRNVGYCEYLPEDYIVNDLKNIDEWVSKIINLTNKYLINEIDLNFDNYKEKLANMLNDIIT
jgi:hypothetical protein